MNRRKFIGRLLAAGAGLAAISTGYLAFRRGQRNPDEITGRIMGAAAKTGHRLRSPIHFQAVETLETETLIVGAGAAGLSAAWAMLGAGRNDFMVLDLEEKPGGNSSHGKNEVSAYPWGAHYIPIPDPSNTPLLEFFEALGIVKGYSLGKPVYEEAYLCQAPHERLLIHGSWQEGLLPKLGVPEAEQLQIAAFTAEMDHYKVMIGSDGRPAFCIPVANSSQDNALLALDQSTMAEWMHGKGWDSPHLHWYVDYCCRDDFGTSSKECSAWAGIHYFAARAGTAANAVDSDVLTWPEGNGWIIQQMVNRIGNRIHCGHLLLALRNTPTGVEADVLRLRDERHIRIVAKAAVFSGPRFVAERVVEGLPKQNSFSYAPWVVANVTVSQRPIGHGAPLSWDNVAYGSHSLGYIVADHQALRGHSTPSTVLTWYEPLTHVPPAEARREALAAGHAHWRNMILADLESMHSEITEQVENIDVWVWGHGMIRPVPGFITGDDRKKAAEPLGRIAFAHTDLSGISIFEEAFFWGKAAADLLHSWLEEQAPAE